MCTYDYTPYTGCKDGQQHFYIQWMKCNKAIERSKYCPLNKSTQAEVLKQLSTNVLSCPIHGPIAVQQYVFDLEGPEASEDVSAGDQDHLDEAEGHRVQSMARRGRATKDCASASNSSGPPTRSGNRKRRPARDVSPGSSGSDSESSGSISGRLRRAERVRKLGLRDFADRRKSSTVRANAHRRASSVDILPPVQSLSTDHSRRELSPPMDGEVDAPVAEDPAPAADPRKARPKSTFAHPAGNGIIGLPSSPDMLRRGATVHRSRSEGLLRQGAEDQSATFELAPRNTFLSASDSSPDRSLGPLLFSTTTSRGGRRTGARSIRDRSVDTAMGRIDEHIVQEDHGDQMDGGGQSLGISHTPMSNIGSPSSTVAPSGRQSHDDCAASSSTLADNCEHSRPHLHSLQIPDQNSQHQRDASPASKIRPPQQDSPYHSLQGRRSPQQGEASAPTLCPPISPQRGDETSSLRSTRSRTRRFEDQVAEGRKWAAAREHMPMAAVAARGPKTDVLAHMSGPFHQLLVSSMAPAGRESVDSEYRSGQGHQQRRGSMGSKKAGGGGSGERQASGKRLQKTHPPREQTAESCSAPAPLAQESSPPCARPPSSVGQELRQDDDVSVGKEVNKVPFLQRKGLRRKLSGLLWDRGGQREVGAVSG